jgi:hypothetical protein
MRVLPLLLLTALAPAAAAAQADPQSSTKQPSIPTVVVTASPLSETERNLKECVARKCPVEQDVAATLRHAENLFVAGRYVDARRVLASSRTRNRRFAKAYPVPVSNVLRAQAVVASHLGEGEEFHFASVDSLDALKAGLPADDPRVLSARIEVADAFYRLNRFDAADATYRKVSKRARELGLIDIAGLAEVRLGSMYTAYARRNPAEFAAGARHVVDQIVGDTDPRYSQYAAAGRVLKARLALDSGNNRELDRIIAELRSEAATSRPLLIYSPPIESLRTAQRGLYQTVNNELGGASRTQLDALALRNYDDQWVDVGFYVTPDGRVADASVLRQSPKLESDDWTKPVVAAISARRYLPLKLAPNDPGAFRVERYTLTSLIEDKPGSRIRGHAPQDRIEVLDLTVEPQPSTPSTPTR